MAKLTTKSRNAIPTDKFALPGRRYPIEDRSHAQNALARVSQHGSPSEKAEVRAKVHEEYPSMSKPAMPGVHKKASSHPVVMTKAARMKK